MSKLLARILFLIGFVSCINISTITVGADEVDASVDIENNKQDRELGVVTQGELYGLGSATQGLTLHGANSFTSGVLDLIYEGKSILSVGINEITNVVLSVPDEFVPLVNSKDFLLYMSGYFQFNNGKIIEYSQYDMRIEDNGKTIRIVNPPESWLVYADFKVHISLDLGSAINASGIRIENAKNGSNYPFSAGLIKEGYPIDWDLINQYNAKYTLPIFQLDPGWDLLQQKPTIEDVYDIDTSVSGQGTVGANIQVKIGDYVIGESSVGVSGVYHVDIPKQSAGVTLTVIQNTGVGWSQPVVTVVKHKDTEIPSPIVNEPITDKDTRITGMGSTFNNTIIIYTSLGNELGRSLILQDRSFNVAIPIQMPYTILRIVETNGIDTSTPTEIVVRPQ